MRRLAVGLALVFALGASCVTPSKPKDEPLPAWLLALTDSLERQPVANPPAFIARYDYRSQVVYYLPPRCCDIWSNLYDSAGAIICHPDGGFSGAGDGRCPDFFVQRANEKIVWRDPRGAA